MDSRKALSASVLPSMAPNLCSGPVNFSIKGSSIRAERSLNSAQILEVRRQGLVPGVFMKQNFFRLFMLVLSVLLADKAARASEGVIEVMCRNKAKEVALSAYQGCVTEEKTTRLNDIKKRYKDRMAEVKSQFQKELDEMNSKKSASAAAKPESASKAISKDLSSSKPDKPVKGLAKTLPSKKGAIVPAQPIKVDMDDQQAVVATSPVISEDSDHSAVETVSEPVIVDATNE